jgi:hypothetical protein
MGRFSSDGALEMLDIVLRGDRLETLEHAIRIGKRAQRLIWQNLAIAPHAHKQREAEFIDTELQQIVCDADAGRRWAD